MTEHALQSGHDRFADGFAHLIAGRSDDTAQGLQGRFPNGRILGAFDVGVQFVEERIGPGVDDNQVAEGRGSLEPHLSVRIAQRFDEGGLQLRQEGFQQGSYFSQQEGQGLEDGYFDPVGETVAQDADERTRDGHHRRSQRFRRRQFDEFAQALRRLLFQLGRSVEDGFSVDGQQRGDALRQTAARKEFFACVNKSIRSFLINRFSQLNQLITRSINKFHL